MIIDEIYSAAVKGDHVRLESLLKSRQVNISQMYDAGEQGGMRTRFPLLFSVLHAMLRSQADAKTLSLLAQYGADMNSFVLMESGGAAARYPFLAYSIAEWNAPDLTDALLRAGADPCGVRELFYPNGGRSALPMLSLALQHPDPVHADMLLCAGADPNQYAEIYVPNGKYTQYLPPLYYALIQQQDELKCRMLLRAGASPLFPIALSGHSDDALPFVRYVQAVYPQLLPLLDAAIAAVNAESQSAAPAAQGERASISEDGLFDLDEDPALTGDDEFIEEEGAEQDAPENAKPARGAKKKKPAFSAPAALAALVKPAKKKKAAKPAKAKAAPAADPDPARRCYGKFIAYCFANFSILTLAFSVIAPLIYKDIDKEMALIFFVLGLPCLAVSALIWWRVSAKAKRWGRTGVMPQFVLDSLLIFVKVLMIAFVITIPLAWKIANNVPWEDKRLRDGRTVTVKRVAGQYRDAYGNEYEENDPYA